MFLKVGWLNNFILINDIKKNYVISLFFILWMIGFNIFFFFDGGVDFFNEDGYYFFGFWGFWIYFLLTYELIIN